MIYFLTLFCVPVPPQAAVYVCNKRGARSDVRVSPGTGQKGRTDSPASGGSGADDPGGVRTLPHEDNQLGGESQSRLCLHQLLGRSTLALPLSLSVSTLEPSRGTDPSVSGLLSCRDTGCLLVKKAEQWPESRSPAGIINKLKDKWTLMDLHICWTLYFPIKCLFFHFYFLLLFLLFSKKKRL